MVYSDLGDDVTRLPVADGAIVITNGGGTLEMMRNLIADRLLPTRADFRR